ncbi:SGNH/GDSL hydrolase family protein [Clostridium sp.]
MAILKKKFSPPGNTDVIHFETDTDQVLLLDGVTTLTSSLADIVKQTKTGDLSTLLQQTGKNVLITGDSEAFNKYDFDSTVQGSNNAYDYYPGLLSWSHLVRDAIHRNDSYFVQADELAFRNIKTTTTFLMSDADPFTLPFNGRYLTLSIMESIEQIIISYKHKNPSNKAVLYFASNPNSSACKFDIYVDGVLKSSAIDNNGVAKKYKGFEMFSVSVDCTGDNLLHEIKLTNCLQSATVPDGSGLRRIYLCGIGSKYTNIYMTGKGGITSTDFLSDINNKILQYTPDLLVLIIGANDTLSTNLATYNSNVRSILTQTRNLNKNCQILLLTPTNMENPSNPSDTANGYLPRTTGQLWVDVLKKIAIDFNCYFIDTMKLFDNIAIADWRYDNVHMKKYGNTILARTVLDLIMPNGLYDRNMVDANKWFANTLTYCNPKQIHGWVNVVWNTGTSSFDIVQSNENAILSVVKSNDYKVKINFKYGTNYNGKNGFIGAIMVGQCGSVDAFYTARSIIVDINSVEFAIIRTDGSVPVASDWTTFSSNFKFNIIF